MIRIRKILMGTAVCVLLLLAASQLHPLGRDAASFAWWKFTSDAPTHAACADSGDASICYKVYGSGPPLVLLHGGLSNSLDWMAEIPDLAQHFQLVVIDLRGHGQSTIGSAAFNYRLLATDVIAVLNKLEIGSTDVAGWSDGGNVALLLALRHPERVNRLIAISSNFHPDGIADEVFANLSNAPSYARSWLSQWLYWLHSPHPAQWASLRDNVTAMWQAYPQLGVADLESIKTPTLLILGSDDDIESAHGFEMAGAMPNAELIILPGIGHAVTREAASEVTSLISRFLAPDTRTRSVEQGSDVLQIVSMCNLMRKQDVQKRIDQF